MEREEKKELKRYISEIREDEANNTIEALKIKRAHLYVSVPDDDSDVII